MKKLKPVHPLLIALYPGLFLWAHNFGEFRPASVYIPLFCVLVIAALAWFLVNLVVKNASKSAVITSLFFIVFYSYARVPDLSSNHYVVFALSFALIGVFVLAAWRVWRSDRDIAGLSNALNVFSILLTGMCVWQIASGAAALSRDLKFGQSQLPGGRGGLSAKGIEDPPNIYFIVLDAYANAGVLKSIYDYDNSQFVGALESEGFYVAGASSSNYCQTGLSIGSCLNLDYLDDFISSDSKRTRNISLCKNWIQDSLMFGFLRECDYKIVCFATGRNETNITGADIFYGPGKDANAFLNELINLTPLPSSWLTANMFDLHRERMLYTFEGLTHLEKDVGGPFFAFAHIQAPHPPFVFGAQGEWLDTGDKFHDVDGDSLIRSGGMSKEQYLKLYVDQLKYINTKTIEAVQNILANSEKKPIIVIMGDHGPRSRLIWEDPDATDQRECMSILNAYYFPDGDYAQLRADITPVNTFRVVLNKYFGADYELLEDRNYFSRAILPFEFIDVTERVRLDGASIVD